MKILLNFLHSLFFKTGIILIGLAVFFAVLFYSGYIQKQTRYILEVELSKQFQQPITVGKVEGNLLRSLTVKDVIFYNNHPSFPKKPTIHIKALKAHYSLWNIIAHKGDVLSSISRVTVDDASIHVHRNTETKTNMVYILPKHESMTPGPSMSFYGLIVFKDLTVTYQDDLGFSGPPLAKPFIARFDHLKGSMDFSQHQKVKFSLEGITPDTNAPAAFAGYFSTYDGRYDIFMQLDALNLETWGPYAFRQEGYAVNKNRGALKGRIWSKLPRPNYERQFWYNLVLDIEDSQLTLPFFEAPLVIHDTQLQLQNGILTKDSFYDIGISKQNLKPLIEYFVKSGFITTKGRMISFLDTPDKIQHFSVPKEYETYRTQLLSLFIAPPSLLTIHNFDGNLNSIPIKGSGTLDLSQQSFDLSTDVSPFELTALYALFPSLSGSLVTGTAKGTMAIDGPFSSPIIHGTLHSKNASLLKLTPDTLSVNYNFSHEKLRLSVRNASLFDGTIQGKGTFYFNTDPTYLSFSFDGTNFDAASIFKTLPAVSGTFNASLQLTGPSTHYDANVVITSNTLTFLNQSLSQATAFLTSYDTNQIDISELTIALNDSPTLVTGLGHITTSSSFNITLLGEAINLRDISPELSSKNVGTLFFRSDISGFLSEDFFAHPFTELEGVCQFSLHDYSFYNQFFDHIQGDLSFHKHMFYINHLLAENGDEKIDITGYFDQFRPQDIQVTLDRARLGDSLFLQNRLPLFVKPFYGVFSGGLHITANPLQSTSSTTHPDTSFFTKFKDFSVAGQLSVTEGLFQNQPIEWLDTTLNWDGQQLKLSKSKLQHKDSQLIFKGQLHDTLSFDFQFDPSSIISFKDFDILTSPLGKLSGSTDFDGHVKGTITQPEFSFNIAAKDLQTDNISLDSASGKISLKDSVLTFSDIALAYARDTVKGSGYINISPFISDAPFDYQALDYALDIKVSDAELRSFVDLSHSFYEEYLMRKDQTSLIIGKEKVPNPNIKVSQENKFKMASPIVTNNGHTIIFDRFSSDDLFDYYFKTKKDHLLQTQRLAKGLSKPFFGEFTGHLSMKSIPNKNPKIDGSFHLKNGQLYKLYSSMLTLDVASEKKGVAYQVSVEKGSLGHSTFDLFSSSGYFDEAGLLNITQSRLKRGIALNTAIVRGSFPLSAFWNDDYFTTPLNLDIQLDGDNISFLSLFLPTVATLTNEGMISLRVTGTLDAPVINSSEFSIKNGAIFWDDTAFIRSPFTIPSQNFEIKNNTLIIPPTQVLWKGSDTVSLFDASEKQNTFTVSGNIGMASFTLDHPDSLTLHFNMSMNDALLSVNFPQFYQGNVSLKNTSLIGDFVVPLSSEKKELYASQLRTDLETGPTLKSSVFLSKGKIELPSVGESKLLPSIALDISASIKANVSVEGNIFGKGFLSGLANSMELFLEETSTPFQISGMLNSPRTSSSLIFNEGFITILNHEFELLSPNDQPHFFKDRSLLVHNNSLSFTQEQNNETGTFKLIPVLDLTAYTVIEPYSVSATSNSTDTTYTPLLVTAKGSALDLNSLTFDEYASDSLDALTQDVSYIKTYQLTSQPDIANDTDTFEVMKILMPDLFKETVTGDYDASRIIGGSVANQLNSVIRRRLIRPFERQVAQNMGIHQFRLDYNVGNALLNTAGVDGVSNQSSIGFNFISEVTDQLYVRVKTDLDVSAESNAETALALSEIELTYYLFLKNLTLNYANIRDESQDYKLKPRISIKYSYEF